ncbi:hypothetical protein O181_044176 [Austropuccinia psidii MF-1]|uniref:Integrase catalytic domain-containing protein n=1 Tax=Austropuccinia psidii MF-1 TaxID=1389203 RepID=A0A9Q3HGM7_9BASI|nr:hypothetical protein [Austropuccinia psidii MF-1]
MYIKYNLPSALLTTSEKHSSHNRLGPPGPAVLKYLGLSNEETSCLICETNKAHRLPFNHHFDPAPNPMDSIHIDLIGPITPLSLSGFKYLFTIADHLTSFKIMKFLKKKLESFDQFVIAKNLMENQQKKKIKKLTSDRGGEFVNEKFKKLSEDQGFIHILTPPDTPEHNGYAEKHNRAILEKARCLMGMANLPNEYWEEAINTSVFLSNLSPTASRNNNSPYQLWFNCSPRLARLRTFGCCAVIYNLKKHRNWILALPGQEADLKVTITRNAIFNESVFPLVKRGKSKMPWNVKEVLDQQPFYQSTDDLPLPPLPPNETNLPTTINENLLTNIIQQTTDENKNSPNESTLEQTDSFYNESIT